MNWLGENEFKRRIVVVVEDHVYHISELLRNVKRLADHLLPSMTIVCLDRAGPDTDEAVQEWIETFPQLQVMCRLSDTSANLDWPSNFRRIDEKTMRDQHDYCRSIAGLIRHRGLLLQDIELETLEFVPRDRWWESTMLASTVKGIVGDRPPHCAFISNKRGYEATFGAELLAAGHDPRDVLNKSDIERVVVPFLLKYVTDTFPWELKCRVGGLEAKDCVQARVSTDDGQQSEIESLLDIVLWPCRDEMNRIGGRSFSVGNKDSLYLPNASSECETWRQLIDAHLNRKPGVEVLDVGERMAASGSLRPEITNAAARHIHGLRKRLSNAQDIVTVQGHYRLRDDLQVGVID